MPELTQVEPTKNAGFVQPKGGRSANQKRIEQDEAELKALVEENQQPQEEAPKEEEACGIRNIFVFSVK